MGNFEKFVLKKRGIWFHLIVGYLTVGIWAVIYFKAKNKYKEYVIERDKQYAEWKKQHAGKVYVKGHYRKKK